MLLCADENIDGSLIRKLREEGYNVLSIAEDFSGIEDEEVLEIGLRGQALILTEDKRFGEMVYRDLIPTYGVLLLRFPDDLPSQVIQYPLDILQQFGENLVGMFSVLSRQGFRMHAVPRLS